MVKSICADKPGRYQLDGESGEPGVDCCYSELIENGHTAISLVGADGENAPPRNACEARSFPEMRLGANRTQI